MSDQPSSPVESWHPDMSMLNVRTPRPWLVSTVGWLPSGQDSILLVSTRFEPDVCAEQGKAVLLRAVISPSHAERAVISTGARTVYLCSLPISLVVLNLQVPLSRRIRAEMSHGGREGIRSLIALTHGQMREKCSNEWSRLFDLRRLTIACVVCGTACASAQTGYPVCSFACFDTMLQREARLAEKASKQRVKLAEKEARLAEKASIRQKKQAEKDAMPRDPDWARSGRSYIELRGPGPTQ